MPEAKCFLHNRELYQRVRTAEASHAVWIVLEAALWQRESHVRHLLVLRQAQILLGFRDTSVEQALRIEKITRILQLMMVMEGGIRRIGVKRQEAFFGVSIPNVFDISSA